MAESEKVSWGILSRLSVLVGAGMIVAIALKPYQRVIFPFVQRMEKDGLKGINLNLRRKESTVIPAPILPLSKESGGNSAGARSGTTRDKANASSAHSMDKLTDGDRGELEAVLDRL